MKKTVTALMVILPLVFLIALFAITSATSVSADIPASGITINNKGDNGIFSFDIANYQPMKEEDLEIEVLPYKAKNRKYSLSVTDMNTGEPTDIVTLNQDGSFALNDVGMAKLTYTSDDGGYTDSVIFNVDCSGILDFTPTLKSSLGDVTLRESTSDDCDYIADITTGTYTLGGDYYPATTSIVSPKYKIDGTLASINETSGKIVAYYATSTFAYMTVTDAYGDSLTKKIRLDVTKPEGSAVTVNGKDVSQSVATINAPLNTKSFTIYLDAQEGKEIELNAPVLQGGSATITPIAGSAYKVEINLEEEVKEETSYTWRLKVGDKTYNITFAYSDYSFDINSFGNANGKQELVLINGNETMLTISCEPETTLTYEWVVTDTSIAKINSQIGDTCTIKALKDGETTLTVNWSKVEDGKVVASGIEERKLIVSTAYTSLIFNESGTSYGLGSLAIANQKYNSNGEIVSANYATSLFNNIVGGGQTQITSFADIVFDSTNKNIAYAQAVANGVELVVKDNGTVTISATWKHADRFGAKGTALTFTAVNGVYVSTYGEIADAMNKSKQIVLANDIYLGDNLFDDNGKALYDDATMKSKLLSYTKEITTTFDYQFYKNLGKENEAKVRYCLEFTNNAYGNGHTINAEYITHMFDSTGTLRDYAVFRGPLNFIAAYLGGDGTSLGTEVASVKGQDNICFLVRKDNITLNNLVLAGCNDESLYDNDDTIDLTLLDYTGTTLELMSNASLVNCRVKNGRTVVRIHGRDGIDIDSDVNVQKEKINVTIDGCRLQTAREFILKMGTNRVIRGSLANNACEPSLYDGSGKEYTGYNKSACDNYKNDDYFVNNYVLTDVTLKDSTLSTSGLFAIGMESHFAGAMLAGDASIKLLEGWNDLAGTSYPAILHLVGDVALDNWKELSTVDSSTLITTNLNSDQATLAFLSLNVAEMLKAVKTISGLDDILTTVGDKEYVHGGIALYGGGKNYSIVDMDEWDYKSDVHQYNVNISILSDCEENSVLQQQGDLLPAAAGKQDFRFIMYDATSENQPK